MHVRAPKPLSGICRSVYMFARWNINRSKVLSTDVFKILLEIRARCDIFCPYLLILGDGGAENQVLKGGGVIVSVPRSEFCCYVSFSDERNSMSKWQRFVEQGAKSRHLDRNIFQNLHP